MGNILLPLPSHSHTIILPWLLISMALSTLQPQHSNTSSAPPLKHAHLPWDLFSEELLPYKVFKPKFPFFDHNLSHLPFTSIEIAAQSPSITAFSMLTPLFPPLPHFLLYLPSYLLSVLIMNNFNIFPISTPVPSFSHSVCRHKPQLGTSLSFTFSVHVRGRRILFKEILNLAHLFFIPTSYFLDSPEPSLLLIFLEFIPE